MTESERFVPPAIASGESAEDYSKRYETERRRWSERVRKRNLRDRNRNGTNNARVGINRPTFDAEPCPGFDTLEAGTPPGTNVPFLEKPAEFAKNGTNVPASIISGNFPPEGDPSRREGAPPSGVIPGGFAEAGTEAGTHENGTAVAPTKNGHTLQYLDLGKASVAIDDELRREILELKSSVEGLAEQFRSFVVEVKPQVALIYRRLIDQHRRWGALEKRMGVTPAAVTLPDAATVEVTQKIVADHLGVDLKEHVLSRADQIDAWRVYEHALSRADDAEGATSLLRFWLALYLETTRPEDPLRLLGGFLEAVTSNEDVYTLNVPAMWRSVQAS